ncbi:hypothetical protein ACQEVF_06835 [Nonomuraea polychroma]|uniref:hypothetical protein n=1 Tax=Nonomuraea polychroma TaxID=46176 RepID=UPI003D917CE6
MSLDSLTNEYGRQWIISDAVGGGWYAVRRAFLSDQSRERGLSNVRCGRTLEELAHNLAEERSLEAPCSAHPPLRPSLQRVSRASTREHGGTVDQSGPHTYESTHIRRARIKLYVHLV